MDKKKAKLDFKPITADDIERLTPFFSLRSNKTCDSVFLDSFLWRDAYNVRFAISEGRAVQWLMEDEGKISSAMPLCREEELPYFFRQMVEYFNEELKQPFWIYLADEEAVQYLNLDPEEFEVREMEDLKDYLYDGDAMRTLAGKKLHKKKNLVNAFMREYAGRYAYARLCCSDRQDVWDFLSFWREQKGDNAQEAWELDYEVEGIHEILKNCSQLQVQMGGVYIDGKLEAFTVGSYNPREEMAVISIEKANPQIKGLYQFINQQFLIHEFPQAKLVNREDDVGIPGLRQAKLSYQPIGYARKYMVRQKHFPEGQA